MLVTLVELVDFMGDASLEYNTAFQAMHGEIEQCIKRYCKRNFESTSYSLQKYNGTGTNRLFLYEYPVIYLDRLSVGAIDAIRVWNTATSTSATISVASTGVRLVKDGVANSTILFAASTTMSAVSTAIGAISTWGSVVASSEYSGYQSTELLPVFGLNALNNNNVYLRIPEVPDDDFEVDSSSGMITRGSIFPKGFQNVFVTHTSGYATIPDDLQYAVKIFVKSIYDKKVNETWNLSSYRVGDISYNFGQNEAKFMSNAVPKDIKDILDGFRRRMV